MTCQFYHLSSTTPCNGLILQTLHSLCKKEYFKSLQLKQISIFDKIQQNATHDNQALKLSLLTRTLHLWLLGTANPAGYGQHSVLLHCKPAHLKDFDVIRSMYVHISRGIGTVFEALNPNKSDVAAHAHPSKTQPAHSTDSREAAT